MMMELMMKKVKLKIIKFQKKMKISVILIMKMMKMIKKEMFWLKTKIHEEQYLQVISVLNYIIKECFLMDVPVIKKLLLNYLRQKMVNID